MNWTLGFRVLVGALAFERALELCIARAHARRTAGERPIGQDRWYATVVLLNVAWLVAPLAEVELRGGSPNPTLFLIGATALALAQVVRYSAIRALGVRWNPRAAVFPSHGFTARGPYRFVRHPNYTALIVEFAALPFAGGAWISFAVLNSLNALVLAHRVRVEERMLERIPGYAEVMGAKARFIPRWRAR